MQKGMFYVDVYVLILTMLLMFFAFFYILENFPTQDDNLLSAFIKTEQQIHSTKAINITSIVAKDSVKHLISDNLITDTNNYKYNLKIETIDGKIIEQNKLKCKTAIYIERFGFYDENTEEKLAKFTFGFCK